MSAARRREKAIDRRMRVHHYAVALGLTKCDGTCGNLGGCRPLFRYDAMCNWHEGPDGLRVADELLARTPAALADVARAAGINVLDPPPSRAGVFIAGADGEWRHIGYAPEPISYRGRAG